MSKWNLTLIWIGECPVQEKYPSEKYLFTSQSNAYVCVGGHTCQVNLRYAKYGLHVLHISSSLLKFDKWIVTHKMKHKYLFSSIKD